MHDIPAYFELTAQREMLFRSGILFRYAVDQTSDTVLETLSGMAIIDQGESLWKLVIQEKTGIVPGYKHAQTIENFQAPTRVKVKACWYSALAANKAGIKVSASEDANTFAGVGVILVPDDFKVPVVQANKDNVRFYGLTLIQDNEEFEIFSGECPIVLMEYLYKPTYRDSFLLQKRGGGGIYVEKHQFPHLHIPLSSTSRGTILTGKQHSSTTFSFTAFSIPYGYALYTPPDTIHGDGTLIGRYAISVAEPKITADTVLFYSKNTLKTHFWFLSS